MEVLLIEDDAPLADLICRSLTRRGVAAKHVASVAEARTRSAFVNARLVVDLSAVDKAPADDRLWLRQRQPIVLTGASPEQGRSLAESVDAVAYLSKPMEVEELLQALQIGRG